MKGGTNIAIFASGAGSNAEAIIDHFSKVDNVTVKVVCSNNPEAGVIEVASRHGIPRLTFSKTEFNEEAALATTLQQLGVSHIVLAGFLLLIPESFIRAFRGKIINIHPALLPKFGGKGMYGLNVHKAVKEANEKETGITIHEVNEHYDKGKILAQHRISLNGNESVEDISRMVRELEHEWFPREIADWVSETQH